MLMNNALHQVFEYTMRDIYNSELQLTAALPKMRDAALSPDLAEAISGHLSETVEHVRRIEQACQILGFSPWNVTCQATAGLIREAEEQMEKFCPGRGGDAAIIACAQKVEHYEICGYGTMIEWADTMGHSDVLGLLKDTLEEESAANEKLTKIAKKSVNQAAMEAAPVATSSAELL